MSFNPETKRVMGVAFEMVCAALRLSDRGDLANEIIAKRIVELAKAGEHNPDLLCEKKCPEGISRAAPLSPPPPQGCSSKVGDFSREPLVQPGVSAAWRLRFISRRNCTSRMVGSSAT